MILELKNSWDSWKRNHRYHLWNALSAVHAPLHFLEIPTAHAEARRDTTSQVGYAENTSVREENILHKEKTLADKSAVLLFLSLAIPSYRQDFFQNSTVNAANS